MTFLEDDEYYIFLIQAVKLITLSSIPSYYVMDVIPHHPFYVL